jgi:hypothetical protein
MPGRLQTGPPAYASRGYGLFACDYFLFGERFWLGADDVVSGVDVEDFSGHAAG